MQTANERREEIRIYLSAVRFATLQNLMDKFHVSKSTIRRDIDILTETTPLETIQGNGGGIRVAGEWSANHVYLNSEQEALLAKLSAELQTDGDKAIMESILATFVKPKPRA